eukprot:PhM_4_TR11656/c5_g2_i1/m.16401
MPVLLESTSITSLTFRNNRDFEVPCVDKVHLPNLETLFVSDINTDFLCFLFCEKNAEAMRLLDFTFSYGHLLLPEMDEAHETQSSACGPSYDHVTRLTISNKCSCEFDIGQIFPSVEVLDLGEILFPQDSVHRVDIMTDTFALRLSLLTELQ